MKNPKNTLSLDMRCENTLSLDMRCEEEGRCVVELGIGFLSSPERKWLFELLEGAQKGRTIDVASSGEQVLTFSITLGGMEQHAAA